MASANRPAVRPQDDAPGNVAENILDSPAAAMLGLHNIKLEDKEQYEQLKDKMKEIRDRELKERLEHYRPMEDSKGNFAMMLETTLDFFFLTPILFSDKNTGKPFFEPRRRDKPRMWLIEEKRRIDKELQENGYGPPPSLSFVPTPEELARERLVYLDCASKYLIAARPELASDTRLQERQPQPEESTDPELADLYKPRIPPGHVPVTREKYGNYDNAYRMCPIMAGEGIGKGQIVCYIRLPGIYVHLPVYGLPKIVAGNLIWCIRKLYEMFNVRLPAGVKWGELVLRMEGSQRPLAMDDEVLPENDDDNGDSTRIQMPNGDVPILILESREVVVNAIVRGAPKPYVIRGVEVKDEKSASSTANDSSKKSSKQSRDSDSTGPRRRRGAGSSDKLESDSEVDDDSEDELSRYPDPEEYSKLLKKKAPLDPDWENKLKNYVPTPYNARVKLDNFPRGFTVGDLKVALAEAAHLELTHEQAMSLPLWRRVPDLDPFARICYVNEHGEEIWEEIPVDDVSTVKPSGAVIEEIITAPNESVSSSTSTSLVPAGSTNSLYYPTLESAVRKAGPEEPANIKASKPAKALTAADMPPVAVLTKPRVERNVLPRDLAKKFVDEYESMKSNPSSSQTNIDDDRPAFPQQPERPKARKEIRRGKDGLRYKWEVVQQPNSTPLWALDLDTCRYGYAADSTSMAPPPTSLDEAPPLPMNGNVFELVFNLDNVVEDEIARQRAAARKLMAESGSSKLAEGMLEVVGLTGGSSNPEMQALRERIATQIRARQRQALQRVSYERAKREGILDEHLKDMAARRVLMEQNKNDRGLFSTKNLIVFVIIYLLGVLLFMYARNVNIAREIRREHEFAQHKKVIQALRGMDPQPLKGNLTQFANFQMPPGNANTQDSQSKAQANQQQQQAPQLSKEELEEVLKKIQSDPELMEKWNQLVAAELALQQKQQKLQQLQQEKQQQQAQQEGGK